MKTIHLSVVALALFVAHDVAISEEPFDAQAGTIKVLDEQVVPITEPPCSYCSTQHVKSLIRGNDRVIAWLRAAHNGGAFPIRFFLAGPRVVNDTYGLFFYDPDGGYVVLLKRTMATNFTDGGMASWLLQARMVHFGQRLPVRRLRGRRQESR